MTKRQSSFPERFLWGASTSAHQVDGNTKNQWSVWEEENAKSLAAQAEYHYGDLPSWAHIKDQAIAPENYRSAVGTNHNSLYKLDFSLLKALNLNAYRFSIEWSRIEPKEGNWDPEAIAHYKEYFAELKKQGIEPLVTLFHFTLPVWFANKGGFERRANIKYFTRFVEKVMSEFGKDFKYVLTMNEPEVYVFESYLHGRWPPAYHGKLFRAHRVTRHLIVAHKKAARIIHASGRRYKVSIAKNSMYFYPGDDALLTRVSAAVMQYVQDDYVLKRVAKHCDFIGVNYYFSNRVYGYRVHNPNMQMSDLGWDMQPENLEFVLERLHRKYKLPLIVTENGLADANDDQRKWWLQETMKALLGALREGVDVRGYLHWSLLDNFEWAEGRWPRFGLVEVDYTTGKRRVRSSAKWWASVLSRIQKGNK